MRILPGEFMMGCSAGDAECLDDEKPAHRVRITRSFEIGKYEVTQAEWLAVMRNNPSEFSGPNRPVEHVSFFDVQEFLQRLNANPGGYRYRLPTEAEWEYAARAGATGATVGTVDDIAWYFSNSEYSTHPVGEKQPNGWGLHDVQGNVWEWVQDWYDDRYFASSTAEDPAGPSATRERAMRGGSFVNVRENSRISKRDHFEPDFRDFHIGFRLVREAFA